MSRILFLSHSHTFGPFRVGSHHYARELARRGAEVVHVSTPISFAHRVTGRISAADATATPRGPLRDADGVTHLVPRTMLPAPYGRFRAARALTRAGIDPHFDVVLLDQPLLWSSRVRALAPTLIYRPTDEYPSGIKNRLQREILDAADGVVATSAEVLRRLGPTDLPTLVLENGVASERFAAPGTSPRPPVCVYVGALDARFDWTQLTAWAQELPEVRFVIAGPLPASAPPVPPNVEMRGPVPYDALPELLRDARVGLLPLSDDPLNAGRSPMKLYEYLAAGLSVVARETTVIHARANAGAFTYADAAGSTAALTAALAAPSPNAAGVARAQRESWGLKAEALREFVVGLG